MRRIICLLLLGLLAGCQAQQEDCNLADAAALSRCVRRILLEKRTEVKRKADPLPIPDKQEGDLSFWNGQVTGLSNYDIEDLQLTPTAEQIGIRAQIAWPNLRAEISARAKKCKRIIFKKRCVSISARPRVRIERTAGTLQTTLQVAVQPDGTLAVTPSGTEIDITFSGLDVDANIQSGVGRFFNRLFGDPASRYMRRKALRYWAEKKGGVVKKMEDKLDEAIVKELAVSLEDLLHTSR